MLRRHIARQGHHGGGAEQADIHAGRCKRRGRGCHRKIATGDELASGRRGRALHAGNHRLRKSHHRRHHGAAQAPQHGEEAAPAVRIGAPFGEFPEVVPGAERRTFGRDDDGANGCIAAERCQRIDQFGEHCFRQAVARGRAVKGEQRHGVVGLAAENRIARDRPGGGDCAQVLSLFNSPDSCRRQFACAFERGRAFALSQLRQAACGFSIVGSLNEVARLDGKIRLRIDTGCRNPFICDLIDTIPDRIDRLPSGFAKPFANRTGARRDERGRKKPLAGAFGRRAGEIFCARNFPRYSIPPAASPSRRPGTAVRGFAKPIDRPSFVQAAPYRGPP